MSTASQRAAADRDQPAAHAALPRRRRPWWVLAVALPALWVIAVCGRDAVAWVGQPFAGFLFSDSRIVVSIGRAGWREPQLKAAEWAVITAVDGTPVATAEDVHAAVRAAAGGELTYTFRRGAELFRLSIPVRPFTWSDFAAVFAPMLVVGTWLVVVGALCVGRRPDAVETRAMFAVCLALGLLLVTGPDQYGPYRFTPLFFLSLSVLPAAALRFTTVFPWRSGRWAARIVIAAYVVCAALGGTLIARRFEPAVFLPLLYLVYCAVANAILLYVGSLIGALVGAQRPRPQIALALAAVLASSLVPIAVFVSYPLRAEPVSAAWLILPLGLWPVLTGWALLRPPDRTLVTHAVLIAQCSSLTRGAP